jgi:hypothetical protein
MIDCVENLVGYAPSSCDCFDEVPEGFEDVTASESGLFLSDIMPMNFITKYCDDESRWNKLQRFKEQSLKDLSSAINKEWMNQGLKVVSPFTFWACKTEGEYAAAPHLWKGMRLKTHRSSEGITLTNSQTMFHTSVAGEYRYRVYEKNSSSYIERLITISENEVNKAIVKKFEPIKLAMFSESGEPLEYAFVWDATNVLMNEVECSTCSRPKWIEFFEQQSFTTNDPLVFPVNNPDDKRAFGIRPQFTIGCDIDSIICNTIHNNEIALQTLAVCHYYDWAIKCLENLIQSGDIALFLEMSAQYIHGLLEGHSAGLNNNIKMLVALLNPGNCVECNETPIVTQGKILL